MPTQDKHPFHMQSADKSIYWLVNSWKPNNSRMYQLISSKAHLLIYSPTCQLTTSHPINSLTLKTPTQKTKITPTCQLTTSSSHKLKKSATQNLNYYLLFYKHTQDLTPFLRKYRPKS